MLIKANPTPLTRPGVSYGDTTSRAAATAVTIVAPASNTAGIIVWRGSMVCRGVSSTGTSVLAKNAAPTSVTDGNIVLMADSFGADGANYSEMARRELPLFIAAGLGLYSYTTAAENLRRLALDYTIL